jgi:hypothetical protein
MLYPHEPGDVECCETCEETEQCETCSACLCAECDGIHYLDCDQRW